MAYKPVGPETLSPLTPNLYHWRHVENITMTAPYYLRVRRRLLVDLGFSRASPSATKSFQEKFKEWIQNYTTISGKPASKIIDRNDVELRTIAAEFFDSADNGQKFWSSTRKLRDENRSHYPEQRANIIYLLSKLILVENREASSDSEHSKQGTESVDSSDDNEISEPAVDSTAPQNSSNWRPATLTIQTSDNGQSQPVVYEISDDSDDNEPKRPRVEVQERVKSEPDEPETSSVGGASVARNFRVPVSSRSKDADEGDDEQRRIQTEQIYGNSICPPQISNVSSGLNTSTMASQSALDTGVAPITASYINQSPLETITKPPTSPPRWLLDAQHLAQRALQPTATQVPLSQGGSTTSSQPPASQSAPTSAVHNQVYTSSPSIPMPYYHTTGPIAPIAPMTSEKTNTLQTQHTAQGLKRPRRPRKKQQKTSDVCAPIAPLSGPIPTASGVHGPLSMQTTSPNYTIFPPVHPTVPSQTFNPLPYAGINSTYQNQPIHQSHMAATMQHHGLDMARNLGTIIPTKPGIQNQTLSQGSNSPGVNATASGYTSVYKQVTQQPAPEPSSSSTTLANQPSMPELSLSLTYWIVTYHDSRRKEEEWEYKEVLRANVTELFSKLANEVKRDRFTKIQITLLAPNLILVVKARRNDEKTWNIKKNDILEALDREVNEMGARNESATYKLLIEPLYDETTVGSTGSIKEGKLNIRTVFDILP